MVPRVARRGGIKKKRGRQRVSVARRTSPPRVGHENSPSHSPASTPRDDEAPVRTSYINSPRPRVTLNLARFLNPSRDGPGKGCVAEEGGRFEITDLCSSVLPPTDPPLTDSLATRPQDASRRRVRPVVALRLLEVMRDQDVPPEGLEEEDPTVTLPRRLGL